MDAATRNERATANSYKAMCAGTCDIDERRRR